MPRSLIYLIGVCILGALHWPLKERLSGPVFFTISILYLLVLNFISNRFGKHDPDEGDD